jgi:hypothetical protein
VKTGPYIKNFKMLKYQDECAVVSPYDGLGSD